MARTPTNGSPASEPTVTNTAAPPAVVTLDPTTASWDYNGEPFIFSSLPFSSQFRLAKGGFSHMLGNEIASKVVARIRKELGHSKENPIVGEAGKVKIKAYREGNVDKVAQIEAAFEVEMIKAIRDGTLADRAITTREPARSPVDRLALAKMGVAVEQAFVKLQTARKQLGQDFTWKNADVTAKVKEYASNPAVWAKYKAQAEAEMALQGEDELDLGIAA